MSLIQAQAAAMHWDGQKKRWRVTITAGEEVIKRLVEQHVPYDSTDESLSGLAVGTAREEGYELSQESVKIER